MGKNRALFLKSEMGEKFVYPFGVMVKSQAQKKGKREKCKGYK